MVLGISYAVWLGILGAIGLMLWTIPKKSNDKLNEEKATYEQFRKSCDEALEELTEMRWINITGSTPDQVSELLNKIEVAKITVMYQFFVRGGKYDMFFRCRQSQLEELKKILDLE
jgi:hypothetical protein